MLNATNDFDFSFVMYEVNKLILNSKKIRDVDNVKCTIYYYSILSH